jgi:SAM-dependent methyltransferase
MSHGVSPSQPVALMPLMMQLRAWARERLPWLKSPYHGTRALVITTMVRTAVGRRWFQGYRVSKGVQSWGLWLAKRRTDPQSLAEESYWQYYEETGLRPEDLRGLVVVDIASGPRNSLARFEAAQRIGIEPTILGVEKILRARHGTSIREHDMLYLPTVAEDTLLPTGKADVVFCINAFDHLDDPAAGLAEFARILKPGGRLFLSLHDEGEISANEPNPLSFARVEQLLRASGRFDVAIELRTTPRPRLHEAPLAIKGASPEQPIIFAIATRRP